MIPNSSIPSTEQTLQSGQTYSVDFERGCVTGLADGLAALEQSVYLALGIERYAHEIYSWRYGFEAADLIGKPKEYAFSEIQRRITEALLQDDRIIDVTDFEFDYKSDAASVSFTVKSTLGDLQSEKQVGI